MDENIIQSIYKSCDEKNTNSVAVSSLIEFIKPYMPNNVSELVELKLKLDPENSDPHVGCKFFHHIMSDWIANIQAGDPENSFSEFSVNLNQSLSPPASRVPSYRSKSNNNIPVNGMPPEEQIEILRFQLNKATTDLNLVRQQLTASEEQNESLLVELNLRRKTENLERHTSESLAAISCQNEDIAEEVDAVGKKCEQLERMLSIRDKQQQKYLDQIVQLESENTHLRNKVQSFEQVKRESRKSLSEMRDSVDVKESEISTLMEIIDNLKCELEEKTEVAGFYANEHKLLKQRTHELETLLRTRISHGPHQYESNRNSRHVFNTPKLQSQLANPVTPILSSPVPREFMTSSPVRNSSMESVFSNNSDLMCNNVGVVSALRSPHKTLKEELAEISYGKISNSGDDLERLYKVAKDQESIKNSLWENMKQLTSDNEMLLDYKKEYFDLLQKMEDKERYLKQRAQKSQQINAIANCLDLELRDLEKQLCKQKLHGIRSQIKLRRLNNTLSKKIENDKKTTMNQSVQTDWNVNITIPEYTEFKHTNYAKLQLKMDRLLEKKEKVEKDLTCERAINVKLTLKCQAKCAENVKVTNELELLKDKILTQEKLSGQLALEQKASNQRLEILTAENSNLASENGRLEEEIAKCLIENQRLEQHLRDTLKELALESSRLKEEISSCIIEKQGLEENLRDALEKLALEAETTDRLRVELEVLLNNQYQMQNQMQEGLVQQFHLKRELFDLRNVNNLSFMQLRDEFVENGAEIRTLKKQIELVDGRFFLYSCNEELQRILRYIYDCFKSNDDWIEKLSKIQPLQNEESIMDLENQMVILNNNLSLITSFLQDICNTYIESLNARSDETDITRRSGTLDDPIVHNNSETCDDEISTYNNDFDDSFASCSSEFSFSEDITEIELFECDSFLNSLEIEHVDLRDLSKKQMEEKFTTFALLLTVDVPTLKKRNVNEKVKFRQSSMAFFSRLNYSIHLLNNFDCHPQNAKTWKMVHTNLQLLKEISHDMLRTAVSCAVLDYEKKVTNSWTLIVNYLAMLSQENRNMRDSKHGLEVKSFPSSSAVRHQASRTEDLVPATCLGWSSSRIKFWLYTGCFLLILVAFIEFIFYIDHLCPKTGKRTCPIQWIVNLFVEKTHLHKYQW